MRALLSIVLAAAGCSSSPPAATECLAAGAIEGGGRQALNIPAIVMFLVFVAMTLGITKWAANRTQSAADFYAAGGGITGFQNGLAIAGDYMSAASFLGISGLVFATGFDGLIYSVGWLVGWPHRPVPDRRAAAQSRQVHLRRRRLVPARAHADPHPGGDRHADRGGVLPDRADGRRRQADRAAVRPALPLCRHHRRRADDRLRHLRRHGGDDLGADHQGLPAARRRDLHGVHGAGVIRLLARGDVPQPRSISIPSISPSWRRAGWSAIRSRRSRSGSR